MVYQQAEKVQQRLVLLVPGFAVKPQRNQTLNNLVHHLAAFLGCTSIGSVNIAGYAGKRIATHQCQYDFFELYWQDLATQLTDEKIWTQLWRGLALLLLWTFRAFRVFRRYWQWTLYLALGLFVLLFWYYGIIAVGLNSVGSLTDKTLITQTAKHSATLMLGWWPWAIGSLIVGALAINVGFMADITDVMTRYFGGVIENNGLTLREHYGLMICESVGGITGQQQYDKVIIIGHSFGAAIVIDAIGAPHNEWLPKCELVTLGAFLEFLQSVYPDVKGRTDACLARPQVTAWADYYATDDAFSSHKPLTNSVPKYAGIKTNNGAGIVDRVTGKSHAYYFANAQVLQTLAGP